MAFNAGDIETRLTIDRSPFRTGLAEATKEAREFEKRGVNVKLNLDKSAIEKLDKAVAQANRNSRGVKIPIDYDRQDLATIRKLLDQIGDSTEVTARRSGNRIARALLNPLVMQLGLIPGIALAAGTAGAAALGVLPLAFAGIGFAAIKSSEEVKSAYAELWYDVKTEAKAIAAPLEDTFVNVSNRIFGAWRQMRPELAMIFRDIGPQVEVFADGVLGAATEAVPRFRQAIQLSGPAVRGMADFVRSLGIGIGDMTVEMSRSSAEIGQSARLSGQLIEKLLADVGRLVGLFAGFYAQIGPQWNAFFDQLMNAVVLFTEGGLRGLEDGLQVTLGIAQAFLAVIGPFADVLGQVGGYALAARGSWMLFAGAIGLVAKAWGLLSPAAMITRLSGVSAAMQAAASSTGVYVTRMTGSEKAGDRFAGVMSKVSNAVVKTAASLPILGTAFAVGKAVIDHYYPSADDLASAIQRGGQAAEEARGKMYDVALGYNAGSMSAQAFAASGDEVRAALEKQRAGMTELERAQADAAKAQADYDYAVDRFGENSPQAIQAQRTLANATNGVVEAQEAAARATQDHTDEIIEQTNLMLGAVGARLNYQSALLQLEEAQRGVTEATKNSGAGSLEARQANIQYQQSLLDVVNSIGQRVMAENKQLGETKANELATAAMRFEIARLAVEAGTNLPPALAEMAAGLTNAELKALGVERQVTATGDVIYAMPPGKTLSFPNNATDARVRIEGLTTAVYNLPTGDKWLNYYINYVVKGNPPAANSGGVPGMIGSSSGGRAKGGPVKANSAYWVGEEGIPELFFPNVDGMVLSGRDSKELLNRMMDVPRSELRGSVGGGDGAAAPDMTSVAAMVAEAVGVALRNARWEIAGEQWVRLVDTIKLRNGAR